MTRPLTEPQAWRRLARMIHATPANGPLVYWWQIRVTDAVRERMQARWRDFCGPQAGFTPLQPDEEVFACWWLAVEAEDEQAVERPRTTNTQPTAG